MATSIYEAETLKLDNGIEIKMVPLKIAGLRKFMNRWADLVSAGEDNDKSFDVLTDCVVIALEQWDKEHASAEWVEENLDMNNYYDMIRVGAGIDMRSPGNE